MTDVIELAKQAGIDAWWESGNERREELDDLLTTLAALVRNAALTEAAEVCFRNAALTPCPIDRARMLECGASIRNLKEPTP